MLRVVIIAYGLAMAWAFAPMPARGSVATAACRTGVSPTAFFGPFAKDAQEAKESAKSATRFANSKQKTAKRAAAAKKNATSQQKALAAKKAAAAKLAAKKAAEKAAAAKKAAAIKLKTQKKTAAQVSMKRRQQSGAKQESILGKLYGLSLIHI